MSAAAPSTTSVDAVALTHRYRGGVTALNDVSLAAERGEFLTLLGPSGCGKTTLLRIIGGFERPTAGRVVLAGHDVTATPPHRRSVNMVFQRPTLFPHLDVAGNVAFGLRVKGISRRETATRVAEALALVRLGGYESRRSGELSGGQLQRVALARAIVMRPEVLLLDEPLSALDLKIRLEMEVELRRLHRELGATFIYVTHDQREALALSDRVAVFSQGRIEQLGSPTDVYDRPRSVFAARFVGDANVIPAEVLDVTGDRARIACGGATADTDADDARPGPAWLVVKPEAVRLAATGEGLQGVVEDVAFRGTGFSYRVAVPQLAESIRAEIGAGPGGALTIGTPVAVTWARSSARLLARDGGQP